MSKLPGDARCEVLVKLKKDIQELKQINNDQKKELLNAIGTLLKFYRCEIN